MAIVAWCGDSDYKAQFRGLWPATLFRNERFDDRPYQRRRLCPDMMGKCYTEGGEHLTPGRGEMCVGVGSSSLAG